MLKVEDLSKSYRTGDHVYPVLKNLSFQVEKGEFVAVMGPSGSGKTTLLNCISCFIPHDSGKIFLNGKDLSGLDETGLAKVRNQNLGFVFQDFMLLDGLTVFENICLPQVIASRPVPQMEAKAARFCEAFGIEKIRDKYPAEISGGEKQRTAVARALMNSPYILLADEPTGNLDSRSCRAVIDAAGERRDGRHSVHGDPRQFCGIVLRPGHRLKRRNDLYRTDKERDQERVHGRTSGGAPGTGRCGR